MSKRILPLLVLCLMLAACGPKEPDASGSQPDVSSSAADISQSEPDTSPPDASEPDSSAPDASAQEDPPAPLTQADKNAAQDAAYDYYLGTVFDVHGLTEVETRAGEITFQVSCSKGGEKVDPDRTVSLERKNGAWTVVSEGY